MVVHCFVLYCMLNCIVLQCIIWYHMVLNGIAWQCMHLMFIVWYCIVLYCVAWYFIVTTGQNILVISLLIKYYSISNNNHAQQYKPMQYHAIQMKFIHWHAMPYDTMQYLALLIHCHETPYNTLQYHTIRCITIKHYTI